MLGAGVGTIATLVRTAVTGPSAPRAAQAAFGSLLLSTAPFTAGAGALYTIGSCLAEDFCGARDWRTSATGGVLAGAVVLGLKQRSLQGGFVGAVLMGSLCAVTQLAPAMENSTERQAHRAAPRPVTVSSEELAVSAANSRGFTSRLQ